jgi:CRISPR-associated protein Cst1
VYEHCLNGILLDDLIEQMLKMYFNDVNKSNVRYCTTVLVELNESWKGNLLMKEIDMAKKMGYVVSCNLIQQKKANKVISYKQKIIGALVAHDYDRVNEVILSLAAYVGMEFAFAYPLFENPEENKNIAFAFANALTDNKKTDDAEKEN